MYLIELLEEMRHEEARLAGMKDNNDFKRFRYINKLNSLQINVRLQLQHNAYKLVI